MCSFLRRDRIFAQCLAVALVMFLAPWAARAGFDPAFTRSAEGETALKLEYRLEPSADIDSVSVTQNGGEVTFQHLRRDATPGALLVMLDTSAGSVRFPRDRTLAANRGLVQALMAEARPQNVIGVYAFANDLTEVIPMGPPLGDIRARLAGLKANGLGTRIYRQGLHAVGLLTATPTARKVLFIISDGKDEDNGFTREDLVRSAQAHGVTICAMGCPESGIDVPALGNLEKMAAETGGLYAQAKIGEGDPAERLRTDSAFARSVMALINSGGEINVPLSALAPAGDVSFVVKTKAGETFTFVHKRSGAAPEPPPAAPAAPVEAAPARPLVSNPSLPLASASPSAAALKPVPRAPRTAPAPPQSTLFTPGNLISGGAILLLVVAVVVLRVRSRPAPVPAAPRACLVMQDATSSLIPLTGIATRLGRRPDNDIVFANTSVSGYHAEIHLRRDGTYLITDLGSGNGLSVNGKTVSQATLNDGDLVEMGEVRFRFQSQQ